MPWSGVVGWGTAVMRMDRRVTTAIRMSRFHQEALEATTSR